SVATLVRILTEKGFIKQTHGERPYRFRPVRSFDDVSRRMVSDLVKRVFHGSRESLLVRLLDQRELTDRERTLLEDVLRESDEAAG
ncbi:MAG: BlaI/MecI/CopY family transcriptional regulator, partial [Planctomycetes bacterium]|nr:BlaI/MecI/CopY family transcriptional regulator [Planctomycetota bacterium]